MNQRQEKRQTFEALSNLSIRGRFTFQSPSPLHGVPPRAQAVRQAGEQR